MVYFFQEESMANGQRQRFTARPLDGKSEGDGLAITLERGQQREDVDMDLDEAKEFAKWMVDHFGLPSGNLPTTNDFADIYCETHR